MHLIIIIAVGVFGGLWLFRRWSEWHDAPHRATKRFVRGVRKAERRAEVGYAYAALTSPHVIAHRGLKCAGIFAGIIICWSLGVICLTCLAG